HDQKNRPAMPPIQSSHIRQKPENSPCHQHRRTNHAARFAAFALAAAHLRRNDSPAAREHPEAQSDQEQWPDAVKIELQRSIEKKKRAESDQNDRASWHLRAVAPLDRPE